MSLEARNNPSNDLNAEGPFKVKALKKFLEQKEQQELLRENALRGTHWTSCPVLAQLVRGVTDACASHQWQDVLTLLPCIAVRCYPQVPVEYCAQVVAAVMGAGLLDGKEMPAIVQAMAPSSMLPLLSRIVQHTSWEEQPSQSLLTGTRPTASPHDEARIRSLEEMVRGPQKKMDSVLRNSYRGLLCYLRWRCACDQLLLQEACEVAEQQRGATAGSSRPSVAGLQRSPAGGEAARSGDASDEDDDPVPDAGPSAAELSQQLDQVDDVLRQLTSDDGDLIRLAEQAAMLLEPCVHDSAVPCEWLFTPLLETVHASRGLDAVLDVARQYLRRHLQHAPAHRAVLQFVRAHESQHQVAGLHLQLLKNLQRLSPGDDSVLVLAETLLDRPASCTLEDRDVAVQSDAEDDDEQLDEDSCIEADSTAPRRHCCLSDGPKARSCVAAVRMLVLLLHCPHWREMLRPWELLHRALAVLHSAWLNCWQCRSCRWSRRAVLASVTPWWRLWWARHHAPLHSSGDSGPAEDGAVLPTIPQAKLAMHRAVVAHVLCIDVEVRAWREALLSDGWSALANELRDIVGRRGPHTRDFERFRRKHVVKARWEGVRVDGARSPVRGEQPHPEESDRYRLLDRRLGGDSQVAEWVAPAPPPPITPRCLPGPPHRPDVGTPLVCRFVPLLSEDDSDFETSRLQPKKAKIDLRRRQTQLGAAKDKTKPKKPRSEGETKRPKKPSKSASAASADERGSDAAPVLDESRVSGEKESSTAVTAANTNTLVSSPARCDTPLLEVGTAPDTDSVVGCGVEVGPEAVSAPLTAGPRSGGAVSASSRPAAAEWPASTQCSGPSQDVVPCGQPVVERQPHQPEDTDTDLDLPLFTDSFHFASPLDYPQHDTDVDDSAVPTACDQLFDACSLSNDSQTSQSGPPAGECRETPPQATMMEDTRQKPVVTLTNACSSPSTSVSAEHIRLTDSAPVQPESSQHGTAEGAATMGASTQYNDHSVLSPSPDVIPSTAVQEENQTMFTGKFNSGVESFSSKRNKLSLGKYFEKSCTDANGVASMDRNQNVSKMRLGARQMSMAAVPSSVSVVPGAVNSDSAISDDSDAVPPSPLDTTNFEARHYERCTRLDRDERPERGDERPTEECAAPDHARQTERLPLSPFDLLSVSQTVQRNSELRQSHSSPLLESPIQNSESEQSSPLKNTSVKKKYVIQNDENEQSTPLKNTSVKKKSVIQNGENEQSSPLKNTSGKMKFVIQNSENEQSTPLKNTSVKKKFVIQNSENEQSSPLKNTSGKKKSQVRNGENEQSSPLKKTSAKKKSQSENGENERSSPLKITSAKKKSSKQKNEKEQSSLENTSAAKKSAIRNGVNELSSPLRNTCLRKASDYFSRHKTEVVKQYSCGRVISDSEDGVTQPNPLPSQLENGSRSHSVRQPDAELPPDDVVGQLEIEFPSSSPVKRKIKHKKNVSNVRPEQAPATEVPSLSSLGDAVCETLAAERKKKTHKAARFKEKIPTENYVNEHFSSVKTPKRQYNDVAETEQTVPRRKKKKKVALDNVAANAEEQVMSDWKALEHHSPSSAEVRLHKPLKRRHLQPIDAPVFSVAANECFDNRGDRSTPPRDVVLTDDQVQTPSYQSTRSPLEQKKIKKGSKHKEAKTLHEDFPLNQDQENDPEEPAIVYEQTVSRVNYSCTANSSRNNAFKTNVKETVLEPSSKSIPPLNGKVKVKSKVKRNDQLTGDQLCNDQLSPNKNAQTIDAKKTTKKKNKRTKNTLNLDWINTQDIDAFVAQHYKV